MIDTPLFWLLSVAGALLADACARAERGPDRGPERGARLTLRQWPGLCVTGLFASLLFGAVLALSGNPALAAILVIALQTIFVVGSNAKRRVLGEPLVFSDLALFGAMAKHPQFYFSVLALWQQIAAALAVVALVGVMAWLFEPRLTMAAAGGAVALVSGALVWLCLRSNPWSGLARAPDLDRDLLALGLVPTLLLYWRRWRQARAALRLGEGGSAEPARAPRQSDAAASEIIVVVQCESFADPCEIFAEGGAVLPHLAAARGASVQWGNLHVSGFGAYTMRTEYGVLFGREEDDLGFLLYDPYLTALDDPARALPQKLETRTQASQEPRAQRWQSLFVHPHDMRFYGRDQILPKAGFTRLIGEDAFTSPDERSGRYVSDAEVAETILDLARAASSPTLIYAVTMENHGPWAPHGDASTVSMVENYNRLVLAGDAMLGALHDGLCALGRPATLVFFGDHRPTIPGASDPGGDKHTPYVIVQCGHGTDERQAQGGERGLTPAQLHEAILTWGLERGRAA